MLQSCGTCRAQYIGRCSISVESTKQLFEIHCHEIPFKIEYEEMKLNLVVCQEHVLYLIIIIIIIITTTTTTTTTTTIIINS
jgi:hypothetical protein